MGLVFILGIFKGFDFINWNFMFLVLQKYNLGLLFYNGIKLFMLFLFANFLITIFCLNILRYAKESGMVIHFLLPYSYFALNV